MFSGIIKLTFDPVISNGENVNGRFGDTNIGRDEFVSCFFFSRKVFKIGVIKFYLLLFTFDSFQAQLAES